MPSDPVEQEFPDGQSGAVPTEAKIELILKNQIAAPIEMLMEFKGYNTLGELTYVPIEIDRVGFPINDVDTSVTIITLSKLGTGIQIWETVEDYEDNEIPWETLKTPCDTCSTIIDLLASNPTRMLIQPEVKIEGKTLLRKNAAIDGGFKLTIPFETKPSTVNCP